MAGNVYLYDAQASAIRAIRRRDGRLSTITGNRHLVFGSPRQKEGPADQLALVHAMFIDMASLAAVGDAAGLLVRLHRRDGVWRYETVGGGGNKAATAGVAIHDAKFTHFGIVTTADGQVGVLTGGKTGRHLYWIRDGKLAPAYDTSEVEKQAGGFYCSGIDGAGNFVGPQSAYASSSVIVVVSADGKIIRKVPTPYPPR